MIAAALALGACMAVAPLATADDGIQLRIDWDQLGMALRQGATGFLPRESWRAEAQERYGSASAEPPPWIGTAPRVSLVARDWGVSQLLWGRLSLTDQLRLTHSSRMVVTRVGLANGRIVPFVQLGVGQWRIDTSLVPTLPSDAQAAGQIGGGFELELARDTVIAIEADGTMLYREGRESDTLVAATAHVWGTLLAGRARF